MDRNTIEVGTTVEASDSALAQNGENAVVEKNAESAICPDSVWDMGEEERAALAQTEAYKANGVRTAGALEEAKAVFQNTFGKGADFSRLPRHIAVIMDGNGRWAKKRLQPRSFGHRKGVDRMVGMLEHAFDLGVRYVTVYALSTENLSRPTEELEGLYNLIRKYFAEYMRKICERGVQLRIIGDLSPMPTDVQKTLRNCEKDSLCYAGSGRGVNVAIGYGSRAEIVRAVNLAVERGQKVTEESFASLLYTHHQPDPDLVIRTGKELRLSNFLMMQAAYAELYFTEKLFPDFSDKELDKAILDFMGRKRRFGKTDEQCEELKNS